MTSVTGFRLLEVLGRLELRKRSLQGEFNDALYQFDGENKGNPVEIAERLDDVEQRIAVVQTAQAEYNNRVTIASTGELSDKPYTLQEAVKRLGGLNRMSNLWKGVVGERDHDRLFGRSYARMKSREDELAKLQVGREQAMEMAETYLGEASMIRAAIAAGNTEAVDIEWLTQEDLS